MGSVLELVQTSDDTDRVTPDSPRWAELVRLGVEATKSNWTLGDAALEIAPMGDDTKNTGALNDLKAYSEDIGVEFETLRDYRKVSHAWTHGERSPSVSWGVHRVLMGHKHLIRNGMTVKEARAAVKDAKPPKAVGGDSSPEGINELGTKVLKMLSKIAELASNGDDTDKWTAYKILDDVHQDALGLRGVFDAYQAVKPRDCGFDS